MIYDYDGVRWVLNHYTELRSGLNPDPRPVETVRHNITSRAGFERWCDMAAQVAIRVKKCGRDGLIVYARFGMGLVPPQTDAQMESDWYISRRDLWRTVNKVIWYCTGEDEQEEPYEEWKKKKPYRNKTFVRFGQENLTSGAQCAK